MLFLFFSFCFSLSHCSLYEGWPKRVSFLDRLISDTSGHSPASALVVLHETPFLSSNTHSPDSAVFQMAHLQLSILFTHFCVLLSHFPSTHSSMHRVTSKKEGKSLLQLTVWREGTIKTIACIDEECLALHMHLDARYLATHSLSLF